MLNMLRNHGKKLISGLVLSGILGIGGAAAAQEQPAPSCCSASSCCGNGGSCCGNAGSCGQSGSSCCSARPEQPNQGQAGQTK